MKNIILVCLATSLLMSGCGGKKKTVGSKPEAAPIAIDSPDHIGGGTTPTATGPEATGTTIPDGAQVPPQDASPVIIQAPPGPAVDSTSIVNTSTDEILPESSGSQMNPGNENIAPPALVAESTDLTSTDSDTSSNETSTNEISGEADTSHGLHTTATPVGLAEDLDSSTALTHSTQTVGDILESFKTSEDGANYTGAIESQEAQRIYKYTGGSADSALDALKLKIYQLGKTKLEKSQNLSSRIHKTSLIISGQTVSLQTEFKNASGQIEKVSAQGTIVQGVVQLSTTGSLKIKAVCLDAGPSCQNLALSFEEACDLGTKAYGIYRITDTHLHLDGPGANCSANGTYSKFLETVANTSAVANGQKSLSTTNRFTKIRLETFELTYGEATFDVSLSVLRDDQCEEQILINGPLIKIVGSTVVNRLLSARPTQLITLDGKVQQKDLFMGLLNCTYLLNNDGKGNIKLGLEFIAQGANEKAEKFSISLMRKSLKTSEQKVSDL